MPVISGTAIFSHARLGASYRAAFALVLASKSSCALLAD